jgi:hypothetical protein
VTAAGGRELDSVASAVGRVGCPSHEFALLELVDQADHVAPVGADPVGELLLGERAEVPLRSTPPPGFPSTYLLSTCSTPPAISRA